MVPITVQVQVVADLLTGRSVSEVARQHNLSRPTVRHIRTRFTDKDISEIGLTADRNREEIDALLLSLLADSLKAQSCVLSVVSDVKYLRRQRARDLAKLFATVSDTVYNLLVLLGERENGSSLKMSQNVTKCHKKSG